jgi:hypothetical protein
MNHIFYSEFSGLLSEYKDAVSEDDKQIKEKLDKIVGLYENRSLEEREFADEITLEFSYIISLLKNKHRREMLDLSRKFENLESQLNDSNATFVPYAKTEKQSYFKKDIEVLEAFYNYFKGDYPLNYYQVDGCKFESNEERKKQVNLTMLDYCNRIKTFAKRYLHEMYPEDSIPRVIHGEDADEYETYEPIVFIYENLEHILAKIKTTDENGETVKQRLNIRSALRKLNEFKQFADKSIELSQNNYVQAANSFEYEGIFESNESIEETFRYYLQYHYKKRQFTETQISKAFNMLKFLWKRFYSDYENGRLPEELSDAINKDDMNDDELVNVYIHIDVLNAFLAMRRAQTPLDKSWKDLQVILDVLADFVNYANSH